MSDLKPGDDGWKPATPYGICPCCGSTLEWEMDRSNYFGTTDQRVFTGHLMAIDVRHLHDAKAQIVRAVGNLEGAPKALCNILIEGVMHSMGRFDATGDNPLWHHAKPCDDTPVEKKRQVKVPS